MVNTKAGETAQELYHDLYQPGLYRELWFHWQGKPLLICDPHEASPELREFFTLRRAHWPFTAGQHALRLALGGHLSAALRLHRRSEEARAGERVGRPEPARRATAR